MKHFGYTGDKQFTPLSAWAYLGLTILFAIPVIGQICLIVFACSSKNINRRSFARAWLLPLLLAIILIVSILVVGSVGILTNFPAIEAAFEDASQWMDDLWDNPRRTYSVYPTPTERLAAANATPSVAPFYVPDTTPRPTAASTRKTTSGVDPVFKATMDSYEAFIDEYVDFMSSFDANSSGAGVMLDYARLMNRYAETMSELTALHEDDDMSSEDLAYFLEVYSRIVVKLSEAIEA
jgi:hypothetical protein